MEYKSLHARFKNYVHIEGVSEGILNILGGGSMDYFE